MRTGVQIKTDETAKPENEVQLKTSSPKKFVRLDQINLKPFAQRSVPKVSGG